MKSKEITESIFRKYCSKNNWYCLKLAIDRSLIKASGLNFAKSMPCDFLVFKDDVIEFVEVKEVKTNDSFFNSRFKQQFRMTKLYNRLNKKIYKFYVLINFIKYNKTFKIPVNEYNILIQNKKSLKIVEIPNEFEIKLLDKKYIND